MSVVMDILATYRGPAQVLRRFAAAGQREDRAIAILMAGCAMVFVSDWPAAARQAHLGGQDIGLLLGGTLFAWLFVMPLVLYALAFLVWGGFRALRSKARPWALRLALFWALLAASPLMLLSGLVRGFIGEGAPQMIVGGLWFVVFMWFWISGSLAAAQESASHGD
ncbi:YIP1 family protein [uncultured Lentibacter sp.]|uniref:YIP1 family protein n=1 Tax=uncultured Lentibacter sp. TaxID=1659309 RepID=UPI00260C30C0|nr:YIP1 family protein [uncultured Lentibacter sp.]MCW1955068.1 YIP1 family protein [Roseobacter sp.]